MRRFLMRDIDRVFELRKNLIDDWRFIDSRIIF